MLNGIIGFLSGIISGMGIGGGALLIPALTIFQGISQRVAQGINLAYFIPTACIAVVVHIKNKRIDFKRVAYLAISGIPGAVFGSMYAGNTGDGILRKMFGGFLLLVGIYEIYKGIRIDNNSGIKKQKNS